GEAPTRRIESSSERARWLARGCNEMAETMLQGGGAAHQLDKLAAGYAPAWGVAPKEVLQAGQASRTKVRSLAQAVGLRPPDNSPAQRLIELPGDTVVSPPPPSDTTPAEAPTLLIATHPSLPPALPASEVLTAGIQDITHTLAQESFKLNEVLRMILETIYRS